MRYVYSIVRFVPDPVRGEYVNVGAIAGSEQAAEWSVRQLQNPKRARYVDTEGTLTAAWRFLDEVGALFDDYEAAEATLLRADVTPSEEWLSSLAASHAHLVQLSPPAPMVAEDVESALDRVCARFLLDPAVSSRGALTKHRARSRLRRAYANQGVAGSHLWTRATLVANQYRQPFDFSVVNGRALQLAHTWSFQIAGQAALAEEVRSWGWAVERLRTSGGVVRGDAGEGTVAPDVEVRVVYAPPKGDEQSEAFDDAVRIFEELEVLHTTLAGAEAVADSARKLLVR